MRRNFVHSGEKAVRVRSARIRREGEESTFAEAMRVRTVDRRKLKGKALFKY
jgi:hypothetical protein